MNERLRIAFVDDEVRILQGLQRMLRPHRDSWDMTFHASGAEALAALELAPADVVISDMRMPEMTGDVLLMKIREVHPATFRVVLSGQADLRLVHQSIGPVHQYLGKPCAADTLRTTITQLAELRHGLTHDMRHRLGGIASLPTPPAVLESLRQACRGSSANLERAGEIAASDPAIELRLLQLVNTGFFGSPHPLMHAGQALRLLGIETLQALLASTSAFRAEESLTSATHAARRRRIVALITRIGARAACGAAVLAAATAAARLQGVGALALGGSTGDPRQDAAASAYLMALWGLPSQLSAALHGSGLAGEALALATSLIDAPTDQPPAPSTLWPVANHTEHVTALRATLATDTGEAA